MVTNNLYGWAMIQNLPTGGFEWVDAIKFMPDDIGRLAEDDSKGYLLEVDVKYPKGLHSPHNDHPFMCEKMVINRWKSWFLNYTIKRIMSFT